MSFQNWFYYFHVITVKLLWHNLNCIKRYRKQGNDLTMQSTRVQVSWNMSNNKRVVQCAETSWSVQRLYAAILYKSQVYQGLCWIAILPSKWHGCFSKCVYAMFVLVKCINLLAPLDGHFCFKLLQCIRQPMLPMLTCIKCHALDISLWNWCETYKKQRIINLQIFFSFFFPLFFQWAWVGYRYIRCLWCAVYKEGLVKIA